MILNNLKGKIPTALSFVVPVLARVQAHLDEGAYFNTRTQCIHYVDNLLVRDFARANRTLPLTKWPDRFKRTISHKEIVRISRELSHES